MDGARQAWLAAHPFLEPLARFQAAVEEAALHAAAPEVGAPRWDAWAGDRAAGVPLLRCAAAVPGLAAAAAEVLGAMPARLSALALPGDLGDGCRELREAFERSPAEAARAIAWILEGSPDREAPPRAGLVRYLAWTALRRVLGAAVAGDGGWCGEDRWNRSSCPACGAVPASAHVVPGEAGRPRFLACALCGTRWRWRRIGCAACGNERSDRISLFHVEGAETLRLDACGECNGYLKTYTGEGDEELFLADWPTLHLDVVARARGFRRAGASLYELPEEERRTEPWSTRS